MAQTSRKRQTKHRGNAAGMVTTRGRTTRPPDPKAQKEKEKQEARAQSRANVPTRYQTPPTWRSSLIRATIPTAMIFPILLLLKRAPAQALGFAATAFVIYVPMTHLLDTRMYRRYQKRAAPPARGGPKPALPKPKAGEGATPVAEGSPLARLLARVRPEPAPDGVQPKSHENGAGPAEATQAKSPKPAQAKGAKAAPSAKPAAQPKSAKPAAQPKSAKPAAQPKSAKPAAQPKSAKPAAQPKSAKPAAQPKSGKPATGKSAKPTPRTTARPEPRDHGPDGPDRTDRPDRGPRPDPR